MDSNFQYASTVRWHPSHGFAAASQREAALRGAPASMAGPRSKAQRGSVRSAAAMRSTHREMRCSAAVQAARHRVARRAAMPSAHCEIRPGENMTLQYLSHDGRPAPAVRAAATAPLGRSKDSKLPLCFTLHDAETQSRVPRSTARVR